MEDKEISQHDLEFTGERYVPNNDNNSEIFMQHIQRYIVAKELCKNKKVLDIACGEGYGSDILAEAASSVCGVDISAEAIEHAKNKYQKDNLLFHTGSVADIPFDNESFDIIISFETIEHVSEDLQIQFLNEIKRVLKKDGLLIMSSPDKLYYSDMAGFKNVYHVKELYEEEFSAILKKYFKNIHMYYQGMLATSYIIDDKLKQISEIKEFTVVKKHNQYNAEINIAVCSDIELPSIQNNYIADYANKYYSLKHLVNSLQKAIKDPAYIIEQKENYILEQREKIGSLEDNTRELNGIIEQKENYICEQREKIGSLEDNTRELNGIIEQKENYILEQREKIGSLEDNTRELNGIIEQKENYILEQREKIGSLEDNTRELNGIIEQKENYICEQREKIGSLEDNTRELNGIIEQKENYICEQREKIGSLEDNTRELNGIIEQKENYICEQREKIGRLEDNTKELNGIVEQQTNYIYDQNETIGELKNIKNQQEHELNIYRGFTSNIIIKILYKIYIKMAGR